MNSPLSLTPTVRWTRAGCAFECSAALNVAVGGGACGAEPPPEDAAAPEELADPPGEVAEPAEAAAARPLEPELEPDAVAPPGVDDGELDTPAEPVVGPVVGGAAATVVVR